MKAAVSIVFAVSLVMLPITQVFAQAAPIGSTTAETSLVPEEGSQPALGVPVLTPERALLWQPIAENHADVVEEPSFDPAPVPAWSDWSTEKRIWIVGGIVVGLMVLGIVSIG